jgi:hypothetical protein
MCLHAALWVLLRRSQEALLSLHSPDPFTTLLIACAVLPREARVLRLEEMKKRSCHYLCVNNGGELTFTLSL